MGDDIIRNDLDDEIRQRMEKIEEKVFVDAHEWRQNKIKEDEYNEYKPFYELIAENPDNKLVIYVRFMKNCMYVCKKVSGTKKYVAKHVEQCSGNITVSTGQTP